jgi:hypothetical protein
MTILQPAISLLAALMTIAAFFLLWWKSKSPWLLVAVLAEGISLLLHLAFAVMPSQLSGVPQIFIIWGVCGFVVALCLLGYAVTETTRQP